MDTDKNLKLENQLCFPMYLVAKQIITSYSMFLEPLDLTYTQYLVMMVLWEYGNIDMRSLCKKLFLDSNTLTPVVNRLVGKRYLSKKKDENDKRVVVVSIEPKGNEIKEKARAIPEKIYKIVDLTPEEISGLSTVIRKILTKLAEFEKENR